jgi:HTH-type transcriptional regulator / antitoxin HipB
MRIISMRDLAAAVKGRRLALGLSQAELAGRAGVSRDWVNYFERGKRTVELALVLKVLDALDLEIEIAVRDRDATAGGRPVIDLDAHLAEYLSR